MVPLFGRLKGKTPHDILRFIRRKILAALTTSTIQRCVDNPAVEIVHVMFNDKFNKPYVDFLNRNFDAKKHLVLCLRTHHGPATPFPVGDNVVEIYDIRKVDLSGSHVRKIICHSLFDAMLVEKLYNEPDLLKKSCWILWGGDMYGAPRNEKYDFVFKNFGQYNLGADTEYAREVYGIEDKYPSAPYIFPLTKQMLDDVKGAEPETIRIQVGKSAEASSLDVLDILSKFKDENIRIVAPLSYGNVDFKDSIIKKGISIFGNKFSFIDKIMSPSDYSRFIAGNSILILNKDHQQGIGNTVAHIYLGKKVFIRGDVSTPNWLRGFGVVTYDTRMIENMSFSEFVADDYRDQNMKAVSVFFDEGEIAKMWRAFFN